ncbi:FG-GAP-like repeat-containing protein [Streptomyces gardneri]|uniref:FG-GAP-like repeat-containing protein n=1 Tax=Streptomyces gardneri TaxID=66892 RepID=UPI0036B1690D
MRRGISAVVVAAMSAGLLSVATPGYATAEAPAADAPATSQEERDDRLTAQALKEAKRTGKPVELVSRRTETDEVFINPDGTARVDRALLPVRVRQGSGLVDIDPNLTAGSGGRIAPKASKMAVSFSGGGDDVFATMIREGRTVSLTWPHGKLPKPTVNGRTATYADVLPGVDLTATADDVSFSHALVVKTPAAAKNPAVRSVEFGLKARGLTVAQGAAGEIIATTPARNALFAAPQPFMWDSAGTDSTTSDAPKTARTARTAKSTEGAKAPKARSLQDTLEGAVEGSKRAKLGVKLGAGKLTLTPDAKLLDDPKTVYPVVIDPDWTDPAYKNAWSVAYKHTAYPSAENTVYYNGGTLSKEARVGAAIDPDNGGTVRANTYFRVPIANLAGKTIIDSTLRIKQTWAGSWSCNSGDLLVKTIGGSLPGGITWNNQPAWGALADASGKSYGGRSCPTDTAALVEFDVKGAITDALADKWSSWAFVLTAKSSEVDTSWRKFDPDSARLSTLYNTLPGRPTLSIDPSVPCAGGIIGTTDEIVLSASKLDDDEDLDLDVEFKYAQSGKPAKTVVVDSSKGGTAQLRIPAGTVLPSALHWYEAVVKDGTGNSPRAGRCYFTYDRTGPKQAPKVSSAQFPENVGKGCEPGVTVPCSKAARTVGSFTFSANPAAGETNDITEYVYWSDYDTVERSVKPSATGGSVTVSLKPLSAGPQFLYVRSEDAANNRSSVKKYLFIPSRRAERDKLGDLNGDDLVDLVTVDPGSGTLWTYPGRGDGTFGAGSAAKGETFAAGTVSNGGSWDAVDGYEDVVALQPAADAPETYELWAYRGNGDGKLDTDENDRQQLTISENNCHNHNPEPGVVCDNHWRDGAEIVSVPSFSDDDAPAGGPAGPDNVLDTHDYPDLLVKEGPHLWLYLGSRTAGLLDNFGGPIALGNADWQDMTVMTPGDLNKDGLPEIWARDKVKGTIHEYKSKRVASVPGQGGVLADLTVYGDPTVRQTSIGSGFKGADIPHLATTGDFEAPGFPGHGFADLWSQDGSGRTVAYPGQAPVNGQSFKAAGNIGTSGYDWADCKSFPAASGGTATFSLCGPIRGKYEALGGTAFGKPTSGVTSVSDGGRYVNFAEPGTTTTNRAISWSKTTGAWAVSNGVFTRWVAAGRETGTLGYPTADERQTGVQGGTFITFAKAGRPGAIYWRSGIGSQMITGTLYNQYVKLGGVRVFGYPTGDEAVAGPTTTRVQHFRSGTSTTDNHSFYSYFNFTKKIQEAWPVSGAIRTHWLSKSGHTGTLGLPTSAEFDVKGGRRTNFANGYIRWNRQSYHVAEHAFTDKTAHLRTDLAGDYDGDGKTDIFTVYDYEKGGMGLYVAKANANDGHNPPTEYYATDDPGDWYYDSSKWASGDFDGDGRDDLVGFYGYADGRVKAYSYLSQLKGGPVQRTSIDLPTGQWNWSRSTMLAGDLNGDGRDDLAFVYDYGDGVLGVLRALSRADGSFENPVLSFKTAATWWYAASASYTMGDTNGDGRDDIVALYGYSTGEARLFTFAAKADGHLANYVGSWSVPAGVWERSRGKMTTGDFDKDGRDDLVIMYGHDDGRTEFRLFNARADGGFAGFVVPYATDPGDWYLASTGNLVTGDMNSDGRPDISVSYNYANGETRVFTFHGNAAGTIDKGVRGWYAAPGTW